MTTSRTPNPYLSVSQRRQSAHARCLVRQAAMYLAQQGLSVATIREELSGMCADATREAVAYAERYDKADAAAAAIEADALKDTG